jgi:uncharacterized membrane protein
MNIEYLTLAVAIVSGILVPIMLGTAFPWVLSINSKVAAIVEKVTAVAERIEQDLHQHEEMRKMLLDHEKQLLDHERRITRVEDRNPGHSIDLNP